MTPPLEDARAREEAASCEASVAVTAGAGTGKTTLLIQAVLDRVLRRGCDLREILLLTFTEKAAGEMRLRLENRLRELAAPGPERERWVAVAGSAGALDERLEGASAALDRADIQTIHSFCAHILRQYPVEAGLDPGFQVDEGTRFDEFFDRAWDRFLDEELGAKAPRAAAWKRVLRKADLASLRSAAKGLAGFGIPEEALDPQAAVDRGKAAFREVAEPLAHRLEALAARHPGKNNLAEQMRATAAFLRRPEPGAEGPWTKEASKAEKGWPAGRFDEAAALQKEAGRLAREAAEADDELVREALALLAGFAARFREEFTREGLVTFDGLLTRVRSLLRDPELPKVRRELQRRHRYILVDEFQDTDPVQGEIVLYLAEAPGRRPENDPRKVKLQPGKLFIVGDPKQSIYSFRGADIVAYGLFKGQILDQGGAEHVLKANFRSHSGILGVVNSLFERIIRRNGHLQPEYSPISARRDPDADHEKVELRLFEGAGALSPEEARIAEGESIAAWIRDHVGRRLRYRDVAVLLRALTDVPYLLDALRSAGIPYVVEGEKYFYGTQEVIDFVNLLRAIANPRDRLAVAGLMRSPLGAADDPELAELVAGGGLDYRRGGRPLFEALRELHEAAVGLSVPELIDRIFQRLPVLELAALSRGGDQAVANLLKMRRAAEDFGRSGTSAPTLRQFLRRVMRDVRELTEEGESALADEGLDAVRIMSIHKAKGLEWKVVFLPDLHRESKGGRSEAVRYDWPQGVLGLRAGRLASLGGAALEHLNRLREREESRRLLYVAMTRARERLVLSGGAAFKPHTHLDTLSIALAEAGGPSLGTASGMIQVDGLKFDVIRERWEPRPFRPAVRSGSGKGKPPDWKAVDRRWSEREAEATALAGERRVTSPSRLQEAEKRIVPAADEAERARAASTGTLCHLVLERLEFGKPDLETLIPACAQELGVEDPSEAREILAGFVKTPAFRRLAGAEVLARELPFLRPHEGGLLQGVIDLVARMDGRVLVIDYKSDREEKAGKYGEQKRHYLAAVRDLLGEKKAEFRLLYLRTGKFVEA